MFPLVTNIALVVINHPIHRWEPGAECRHLTGCVHHQSPVRGPPDPEARGPCDFFHQRLIVNVSSHQNSQRDDPAQSQQKSRKHILVGHCKKYNDDDDAQRKVSSQQHYGGYN